MKKIMANYYMRYIFLLFVVILPFYSCKESKTAPERPNIVLFYIDDLGWKDTGYMGSDYYETPNIDKLAGNGLVFTDAYSNAPNCAPSRACLMSGQYTPRHGIYTVGNADRGNEEIRKLIPVENTETLDLNVVTLAEALKTRGYKTIHLGKWHLGDSTTVQNQGFDYNIGGYSRGGPYLGGYHSPYAYPNLVENDSGRYLTDHMTQKATAFIDQNKNNPFFMYFAHYAVHTPIEGRNDLIQKYENKKKGTLHNHAEYASMVASVDLSMGQIYDQLEQLNLLEKTLIVFYSDNGGVMGYTSMKPLRGYKGTIYEGGIRVPMAMFWKGNIKPGTTDYPVMGTDLYPTVLNITGTTMPDQQLDGIDISRMLHGHKMDKRGPVFWHFPAYLQGEPGISDNMRIRPCSAIRDGKYKLIEYYENGKIELYDLEQDIGESNNLVNELPEVKEELHQKLKSWISETNAPIPTELNPGFNQETFDSLKIKYGPDLIIQNYEL
jgi:arylsulfatase A-like enzyme